MVLAKDEFGEGCILGSFYKQIIQQDITGGISMKIGFYGHANNLIFTSTGKNGEFKEDIIQNGIAAIHGLAVGGIATKFRCMGLEGPADVGLTVEIDKLDDNFRKYYYSLRHYDAKSDRMLISHCLGYRAGKSQDNIFMETYDDSKNSDLATGDLLFVWDEGYGGLKLPDDYQHIIWASDKSLPDKVQFEAISDKCFLMLEANILRKAGAMISRQVSWEKTTIDLIREIQSNPAISYLLKAKYIYINFEFDGAIFMLPNASPMQATLILTDGSSEGSCAEQFKGAKEGNDELVFPNINVFPIIFGVMAIHASQIIESFNTEADFKDMMRDFAVTGFSYIVSMGTSLRLKRWDPFDIPLTKMSDGLWHVPTNWTIANNVDNKQLYDVAFDYVREGAKIIEGLPKLSFGHFTTIDRQEIESYQGIRNLILDYAKNDSTRPLSMAVFGAPGSGKSFGVTQIAKSILPGKIQKLEFNVSQFTSLNDLSYAFQNVRDAILSGKLPLVFFDEFDSDRNGVLLGWLKTFLMPMQDGKFKSESGEHPLGKCILVFAGGTAHDFESFVKDDKSFRNVKGPDFVSRLRGTINILDPNPKSETDKNYILRRALLLRGLCERKLKLKDNLAPISQDIIRAMLLVPKYYHGARSMEAIFDMSRIDGDSWEPVSLPSHTQLALHVDADAFIDLVLQGD